MITPAEVVVFLQSLSVEERQKLYKEVREM